ncbi:MAG: hypothetical protein IKO42_02865 [Opitutales bacterium]|nr:hypothetical protein [Opitutales bacterium]
MYSLEQIEAIRKTTQDANLRAPDGFFIAPAEELQKICNGVGADWLSEKSRKICTRAFACVEATAAIHDYRYHFSDGTPAGQVEADEEFLLNGIREIYHRFPRPLSLSRIWAERKVLAAFAVLKRTGRLAWRDAFVEKYLKKQEVKHAH